MRRLESEKVEDEAEGREKTIESAGQRKDSFVRRGTVGLRAPRAPSPAICLSMNHWKYSITNHLNSYYKQKTEF